MLVDDPDGTVAPATAGVVPGATGGSRIQAARCLVDRAPTMVESSTIEYTELHASVRNHL